MSDISRIRCRAVSVLAAPMRAMPTSSISAVARTAAVLIAVLLAMAPGLASAQATIPLMTVQPSASGGSEYATSIQILLVMTLLTLVPAALITMTSFTRILIVLAILRQALGTAQTPSNQIILGLSLFLSLFIMAPVFEVAWTNALQPYLNETIAFGEAVDAAKAPFREFMFGQTRETDLMLFADLGARCHAHATD